MGRIEVSQRIFDGTVTTDIITTGTAGSQGVGSSLVFCQMHLVILVLLLVNGEHENNTNGGAGVFNTVGISGTLTANGLASLDGGIDTDGAFTVALSSVNIHKRNLM